MATKSSKPCLPGKKLTTAHYFDLETLKIFKAGDREEMLVAMRKRDLLWARSY